MPIKLPATCLFFALLFGLGGCAAQPAARMTGVVGSPAQSVAGPVRRDAAADQADAAAASRMPAPVQADAQAALRAAEDAYARGDWVAAARDFKALTPVYPRNGQVWFGLGAASALAGNLDEAAAAFEAALRIDPREPRAAYNLSLLRLSQAEVALGIASANASAAPAPVQSEISRLSRELAPVFNRSADSAPVAAAPALPLAPPTPPASSAAEFRVQDPARASAATPSDTANNPYAATPIIPSAATTR